MDLGHKLEQDFEYNNCVKDADIYIRMDFLRKIYSILSLQLITTVVTSGILFAFKDPVTLFLVQNSFVLFGLLIASFALLIGMFIKRYNSPINLMLLLSFTLVESFLVGFAVIHFDASVVLQALAITTAIVVCLTAYTLQTKRDFSSLGACGGSLLLALIVGGLVNLFIGSTATHFAISIGGSAIFACLLVYDTQMIMQRFSAEEYIAASITLYLDVINLFLYILRALQAANNN